MKCDNDSCKEDAIKRIIVQYGSAEKNKEVRYVCKIHKKLLISECKDWHYIYIEEDITYR